MFSRCSKNVSRFVFSIILNRSRKKNRATNFRWNCSKKYPSIERPHDHPKKGWAPQALPRRCVNDYPTKSWMEASACVRVCQRSGVSATTPVFPWAAWVVHSAVRPGSVRLLDRRVSKNLSKTSAPLCVFIPRSLRWAVDVSRKVLLVLCLKCGDHVLPLDV